MSFASPNLLFGLIVVPLAAIAYLALDRRRSRKAMHWTKQAMLPNVVWRPSRKLGYIPAVLFLIGLTFLLVGFARPQMRTVENAGGHGPTVVVAFDVSGSMAANDVRPTRLRAARKAAIRFLDTLPSSYQVAVITFGDKVRLTVPPTLDRGYVMSHLPTAVTPRAGTSLGDAISAAVAVIIRNLQPGEPIDRLHPPGAVLLLSDGAQTAGGTTPAAATSTAFVYAVAINTVALGTPHGIVTQQIKVSGLQTSVAIPVPASPLTLQQISQTTGGTFVDGTSAAQLTAASKQLATVYKANNLRSLSEPQHRQRELTAAAGGLALAFIAAGIILSGLWFGRLA